VRTHAAAVALGQHAVLVVLHLAAPAAHVARCLAVAVLHEVAQHAVDVERRVVDEEVLVLDELLRLEDGLDVVRDLGVEEGLLVRAARAPVLHDVLVEHLAAVRRVLHQQLGAHVQPAREGAQDVLLVLERDRADDVGRVDALAHLLQQPRLKQPAAHAQQRLEVSLRAQVLVQDDLEEEAWEVNEV